MMERMAMVGDTVRGQDSTPRDSAGRNPTTRLLKKKKRKSRN